MSKNLNDVYLVDLRLPLSGFYNFFSSWIILRKDKVYVIDPGPASTINTLIDKLQELGCSSIDHLLLTHIHLDHAGGAGHLVRNFKVNNILCFEKAVSHLVNPEQLWQGSLKILGNVALAQGKPLSVPAELFVGEVPEVKIIPSPGHAPHHISFLIDNNLYIGEALGVVLPQIDLSYIRPATPPKFFLKTYLNSINLLSKVACNTLCFGHFGYLPKTKEIFVKALDQITLWLDVVKSVTYEKQTDIDFMIKLLVEKDQNLRPFYSLPEDIQSREKIFIKNTIDGLSMVEKEAICG
jgi:glyoxylase-like metal-dependent hydrolase (beta-lactamase superfamily II)